MSRLKKQELGQKLDVFNEQILKIETHLKELYCVKASVPIESVSPSGTYHVLAFGKLANEWRLILELWEGGACISAMPLTNASMDYRFLAIEFLDKLAGALDVEEEEQLRRVEVQSMLADDFLSMLKRRS